MTFPPDDAVLDLRFTVNYSDLPGFIDDIESLVDEYDAEYQVITD